MLAMYVRDFDYALPGHLIAQYPLPERDASRLLLVRRKDGAVLDRQFRDLGTVLRSGDLLVLNDTTVIPARLYGVREGGGKAEILLIAEEARNRWWVLAKPGRSLPVGRRLSFPEGVTAEVVDRGTEGRRLLAFGGAEDIFTLLPRIGEMPLPPYVKRGASRHEPSQDRGIDAERYQTVYAKDAGAIAAPTAGLHFTESLLADLERHGVEMAFLTLHVGVGTFKPVTAAQVREHRMAPERYTISEQTAAAIKRAKTEGRRVVAVGTTTTRALEDAALTTSTVRAGEGTACLFITPGHRFQVVDVLLTNFHLPRSTLFILVCAFAGRDLVLEAYAKAIQARYRFYSYGDAMVIV